MSTAPQETMRDVFVTGLKNAHAMEHQALALMDRQIEHLADYAEVSARLRTHRGETDAQITRLEDILEALGEAPSSLKDAAMTFSGNIAAIAHSFAADEILKNMFANYAFENFEAAAYKSLVLMAEETGFRDALPQLRQSLEEELAMVAFCDQILPEVTRKFLNLRAAGETASH